MAQIFVYGHSLKSTLVGIVVPDAETLKVWADNNGLAGKSFEELCALPKVKETIQKDLSTFGRESDLKGFEIVRSITLISELFSIENDLLVSGGSFFLFTHVLRI